MKQVFSVNDLPWNDLKGLPGARGFEYKMLIGADYTSAYTAELVRLESGDHSVSHVERWNHALYFLSGEGDVTIEEESWAIGPGSICLVKAGQRHSLRNLGADDMIVLAIYDPPRTRNG